MYVTAQTVSHGRLIATPGRKGGARDPSLCLGILQTRIKRGALASAEAEDRGLVYLVVSGRP